MNRIISVSTMAYDGYSLETTLDELAGLGVRHVEPASVDKIFQHLVEEDFCEARAAWLRKQLAAPHIPIALKEALERKAVPDVEDIVTAARSLIKLRSAGPFPRTLDLRVLPRAQKRRLSLPLVFFY